MADPCPSAREDWSESAASDAGRHESRRYCSTSENTTHSTLIRDAKHRHTTRHSTHRVGYKFEINRKYVKLAKKNHNFLEIFFCKFYILNIRFTSDLCVSMLFVRVPTSSFTQDRLQQTTEQSTRPLQVTHDLKQSFLSTRIKENHAECTAAPSSLICRRCGWCWWRSGTGVSARGRAGWRTAGIRSGRCRIAPR